MVITSVDGDDLADGGAEHFAACIKKVHEMSPGTTVEVLTPDFRDKDGALEHVARAKPDSLRPQPARRFLGFATIRPGARYFHSVRILQRTKELEPEIFTKSGIMVGAR